MKNERKYEKTRENFGRHVETGGETSKRQHTAKSCLNGVQNAANTMWKNGKKFVAETEISVHSKFTA